MHWPVRRSAAAPGARFAAVTLALARGADCTVHAREGSEFLVVRASPAAGLLAVVDSGKQLAVHRLADGSHLSGRCVARPRPLPAPVP